MPKRKEPDMDSESQGDRFARAAREHGCDESEDVFNEKLRLIGGRRQIIKKNEAKEPKKSRKT